MSSNVELQNNRNRFDFQGVIFKTMINSETNKKPKVIPLKKQSKKNQRKYYAKQRGTWNGVNPTTKIVKSKKEYDRNRIKQVRGEIYEDH